MENMKPRVARICRRLTYILGIFFLAECIRIICLDLTHPDGPERDSPDRPILQESTMGSWSFVSQISSNSRRPSRAKCDTVEFGYQCLPEMTRFWGQYSPYFAVPSKISSDVPKGCKITFAQALTRHGARDPTFGMQVLYNTTISHIQSSVSEFKGEYAFLKDYKYALGADQLTEFGEQQLINHGTRFYNRYQDLARNRTPFFRASGQERVIQSGIKFTEGFHAAKQADEDASRDNDSFPYKMLTIPEDEHHNNTLSHQTCPSFETGKYRTWGYHAQQKFGPTFIPKLQQKLDRNLPGSNLNHHQIMYLMDLCPFETVARPGAFPLSPFCDLFTLDDWKNYDYYKSIGKYYGQGDGNPIGPTQGVGFVNELIARLTNSPVVDHTCVNHTLDSNPDTFPLGKDVALYADFSHDNDMISIYAALGIFNETKALSKHHRQLAENVGGFSASWTVPFAGKLYVEKMVCRGEEEEMVRVLVNERVVPMKTCGGNKLGLCKLSKFVESLSFARSGGIWDQCYT